MRSLLPLSLVKCSVAVLAVLLAGPPTAAAEAEDAEPLTFGPSAVDLLGGNSDIWCVTVSRDGRLLAAGTGWWDRPGDVRIWDLASRRLLAVYPERLGVASVVVSPDSRLIVSSSWDQTAR